MATHKGGKKGRKYGRNKVFCAKYRAEGRQTKNQLRRVKRHLRHHPNDGKAQKLVK